MDKVILAKNVILDDEIGSSRPNDNQIIFGGTGTGKSMSVVFPTLCHMEESSLIGAFVKKEMVTGVLHLFRERGYRTYTWNLVNPEQGDLIPDPIQYISSDDDIQEMARQIARGNPEYQRTTTFDPYWREASEALLTGLIYYVLITEEEPSLKKVIDLFYELKIEEKGKGIRTSLDNRFAILESKAPTSVAVRKMRSFTQLPYTTAGCVRDDLEKAIQNMFPISIQSAMRNDAYIDFEDFATKRTAIFIITSPVRSSQYCFANLLFEIAIRQLIEFAETRENNRLPRNVKLIFDDFSCGFPIQSYEKTIASFRAAGISSLMVCQSLSQLEATYGCDNSAVILDNCSCLVYFPGGMNKKTCAYISEMINLSMDEIMFMEMGNVIIFQSGKRPIIVPRYDTFADPLYQRIVASEKAV